MLNERGMQAKVGESESDVTSLSSQLRAAVYDGISQADVADIVKKQVEKAKSGDSQAIRFLFEFVIGKGGDKAKQKESKSSQQIIVINSPASSPSSSCPDAPAPLRAGQDPHTHPLWVPTSAMPGSEEKSNVMAMRASFRLPLHHPGDRQEAIDLGAVAALADSI